MKKMTIAGSLLVAVALAVGPWGMMQAEARGGGGAPSGGAPSGGAPSGAPSAGEGGDSGNASSPTASGSPSSSPGVGNPTTAPGEAAAASPRLTPSASTPVVMAPAASPAVGTAPYTVTGEVTQIDPATGMFSLRTAEAGTLNLYAAPPALANVRQGDRVTVTITPSPVR